MFVFLSKDTSINQVLNDGANRADSRSVTRLSQLQKSGVSRFKIAARIQRVDYMLAGRPALMPDVANYLTNLIGIAVQIVALRVSLHIFLEKLDGDFYLKPAMPGIFCRPMHQPRRANYFLIFNLVERRIEIFHQAFGRRVIFQLRQCAARFAVKDAVILHDEFRKIILRDGKREQFLKISDKIAVRDVRGELEKTESKFCAVISVQTNERIIAFGFRGRRDKMRPKTVFGFIIVGLIN